MTRPDDTAALRDYLVQRDVPCPACGYSLLGLTSDRCPECAEQLRLSVGLAAPHVGLLLAGTIGLAAGAGFSVLVGCWGLAEGADFRDLLPLLIGAGGGGLGLLYWVRKRAWVRQRPAPERAVLVAACWVFSVVIAVLFFSVV